MTADQAYAPTARTVPTRYRERARYDRATVHGILDEALICHVGFVGDGGPVVLPTIHARLGETLYLHGSTGSRPMLAAAGAPDGLSVCVTATLVDGLVLARSCDAPFPGVPVGRRGRQRATGARRRREAARAGRGGRPRRVRPVGRQQATQRSRTRGDRRHRTRPGRGLRQGAHRRARRRRGRPDVAALGRDLAAHSASRERRFPPTTSIRRYRCRPTSRTTAGAECLDRACPTTHHGW